jgi:hypothetical protein
MATYPTHGQDPWDADLKTYIDGTVSDAVTPKADLVSGHLPVAQVAAGAILAVHYTGSSWPARPTSRTDVTVHYYALTNADPTPTDFLTNVDYLFKPS